MSKTKHGLYGTRIYKTHQGIKQRCNNPKAPEYKYYGARGITVCQEWSGKDGFIHFYEWAMANGYSDELTIDRIDVNGNYEPSNCRWATQVQQARNKRNNRIVEYDGREVCLSEASELSGIKISTLKERMRRSGALDTSPLRGIFVEYQGKKVGLKELSHITGINYTTLLHRVNAGYTGEMLTSKFKNARRKPVIQCDINGNVLARYESLHSASRETGVSYSSIHAVCSNKRKQSGGYVWRYE